MSKFYGIVGFVDSKETEPGSGIWEDEVTEKFYRGEVTKNYKRWNNSDYLNDNLDISNVISIVADPFISNKLFSVKYVKWLNNYWQVSTAEVQYPRITLTLGGVYNGPVGTTSRHIEGHPRNR